MKYARRKITKMLSAVFTLVFCAVSLCTPGLAAGSAPRATKICNLVVFMQFSHEDGYNFMDGRATAIKDLCEKEDTFRSLYGYINEISYGAMQTTFCYPQIDGDTVTPYIMSRSQDSYTDRDTVALEVLRNISVSEDAELDGDNDGVIDNIIMIADTSADSSEDLFWPCTFTFSGVTINGRSSGMINLHNSRSIFENTVTGGAGTLCHEFLHSVGYPDLYRSDSRPGVPVGQWDIMASDSVFVQYPLAYMRATVSGWLDTADITRDGSYSLAPASSRSGNRVYLLKTPLSDTEFFAVEYRRQGAPYSREMDVKIYGSGLVVYRVDTETDGNRNSDKDEIYVFRPGETEPDAGEGDIFSSNYGGEGNADHIGSLSPDAGIADGALVYSDGTNSGIVIENIKMSDEELTFDVKFAEPDSENFWLPSDGIEDPGNIRSLDICADPGGGALLAASYGEKAVLYKVDEDKAVKLSESDPVGGSYGINEVKLAVSGSEAYILYNDSDYRAVLCSCDTASGEWSTLWKSEDIAQYKDITAGGGNVYFACTSGSFPNYSLGVYRFGAGDASAESLGGTLSPNACSVSVGFKGGSCLVAYRDISRGDIPCLAAIDDSGETKLYDISDIPCSTVDISADGAKTAIAVTGQSEGLYFFDGGGITSAQYPELDGSCYGALVFGSGKTVYTAFNTQSPYDFAVYSYDGKWQKLGNSIADEIVNSPSAVRSGDIIYTAYISYSGKAYVKYLRASGGTDIKKGDVNADGVLNVADAVALQDLLLCRDTVLADPEAADMYPDGILNALDMAILRSALITPAN